MPTWRRMIHSGPTTRSRGCRFFGDLAQLFRQQGPCPWDAARQLALSIATGGESEPNVDPLERIELEQLARVAELHGRQRHRPRHVGHRPAGLPIVPVTRGEWAQRTLDAYRPLFERLATRSAARRRRAGDPDADDPFDPAGDPLAAMLGHAHADDRGR